MDVGLLTARFSADKSLGDIARWAAGAGFKALEVTTGPQGHVRAPDVAADNGAAVKKVLRETGLRISSIACYTSPRQLDQVEANVKALRNAIATARILGVDVVCTLAGFPLPDASGKMRSKLDTIREFLPGYIGPLADEAAAAGIKIAFENWFATNLQSMDHFTAVMEVLPQKNVGFNFDPSHLLWQGVDYVAAVQEIKDRIFHTHAKDTAIFDDKLRRVGCLEGGWWTYVIPGLGRVRWGEYIRQLKLCGYNGVLSIEHEDRAYGPEEGFAIGLRCLQQFV
jgi:sugar phosphate isomerase/epimerase